ncbi:Outer membrane protein TolC [Chitinophaga ginsengisegetis]|uniref:Outer membrane protein TolC n=2 Tax=Chitinophaga ginsengisegetis TaxID=393003 RepID=A0A1T5P880_9BACT|nr:Outer membrane protein TolC [Chitinophaga ginsengisegetis]
MLIICCIYIKAEAQEEWTLKHCIEYGLQNNRNARIYANQKIAADAKAREVLADYLPKVSLTSMLDNNLKLQQNVIPAGVLGPNEIKVSFTQKFNSNALAQLDQVLYDQSLLTGLKANKLNRELADLNIQQSQESIIYNISAAYFQLLVYRQQILLLQFNSKTYEQQMDIYRLQVAKGVVLQKDLDKVSVDFNNTMSQIRVAESNFQLAENQLKFEMGYPIDDKLPVNLVTAITPLAGQEDSLASFSPAARIDYKVSSTNVRLLGIEQARIKAEGLPKLTGYARYGAVGFGDKLGGAYDELLPYSAVGLKLTIPILDFYKRNARHKQAVINRINAEESLKLSESKFTVEFENARTKVTQARTNMENDKRNVDLAESVFKVTNLQFQKGTTDLNDWLITRNSLQSAQNNYLNAMYSYYQARVDLEKAAGTLKTFLNSL